MDQASLDSVGSHRLGIPFMWYDPQRPAGRCTGACLLLAHARCKPQEIFDRDGSPIGAEGLDRIAQFYEIEAKISGKSPAELDTCSTLA